MTSGHAAFPPETLSVLSEEGGAEGSRCAEFAARTTWQRGGGAGREPALGVKPRRPSPPSSIPPSSGDTGPAQRAPRSSWTVRGSVRRGALPAGRPERGVLGPAGGVAEAGSKGAEEAGKARSPLPALDGVESLRRGVPPGTPGQSPNNRRARRAKSRAGPRSHPPAARSP